MRQPALRDYDHDIIAPEAVKTAIEAANAFEVLGGGHPLLSLTWEQYRTLPEADGPCGYPRRPAKVGYVWRTQTKEDLHVGHVLTITGTGCIEGVEWFDVKISDL